MGWDEFATEPLNRRITELEKGQKRLKEFAESMAEGPCWGSRAVDDSHDCPYRMDNGKARHFDWCRRCQAKYWALGEINGNKD